ncbi:MptD family putative ECF transporter S component [Clostridium sp. MB40-C1]|uniref:MptD family putative ECF transporter S component n=1 Tax=Clostridium sp. MB40-C1 TaxID=3070996 RepID=UPI0027DF8D8F|nr:MptD family putative ECF transporter S component [Clostridium sp. MB40-C1]WMJ81791.1 MptD family putative ECF transporter S component [Clostridium sp. MB40-C1]
MKWNMTIKDLTTIGICIAIAVVLGKVLGVLHSIIPLSRGVINAPFYSFLITVMIYKIRKPGIMTMFALGYGLIMIRISIFMSIAIIIGGILADIVNLLILKNYDSKIKIALCAPIYSVGGIIGTFFVVTFMVNSPRYLFQGKLALLISIISVYIAGLIGSFTAIKIMPERLRGVNNA